MKPEIPQSLPAGEGAPDWLNTATLVVDPNELVAVSNIQDDSRRKIVSFKGSETVSMQVILDQLELTVGQIKSVSGIKIEYAVDNDVSVFPREELKRAFQINIET